MNVVGYAYDADVHCPDCTIADTQNGTLRMAVDVDETRWNFEDGYIDSENNFIGAIFDDSEWDFEVHCTNCDAEIETKVVCYCDDDNIECMAEYHY